MGLPGAENELSRSGSGPLIGCPFHSKVRLQLGDTPRLVISWSNASDTVCPSGEGAAERAVGYSLAEVVSDIAGVTPASFEPTSDYVVTKIPRFAFEKFPSADSTLTIQMKSVGEVMAIGRTFKEALQKGIRGLEIRRPGLGGLEGEVTDARLEETKAERFRQGQHR